MDTTRTEMTPDEIKRVAGFPSDFTPVQSSNLEAVKIVLSEEDPNVVQLQVIFKNRTRYHYSDIPRLAAEGILAEGVSVGKYLNQVIKPLVERTVEVAEGELGLKTQPYVYQADLLTGKELGEEESQG